MAMTPPPWAHGLGLLLLRVVPGGLLAYLHGWPKFSGFFEKMKSFSDPLGVGRAASLGLATFAELFCAILVVLGIATRLAAIPPLVTMMVAAFLVHAGDSLRVRELALLFGAAFAAVALLGPGPYALGPKLRRGAKRA